MPDIRNGTDLRRGAGDLGGIPSFVAGMRRGREWIDEARCAYPPYDDEKRYKWTIERSGGLENPRTVLKLFDVCGSCPVRRECLMDALSERRFSVEGCWGGTVGTERRRVMREVAEESFDPDAVMIWPQLNRPELSTSSQMGKSSIDPGAQAEEAARRLEATYQERLRWWKAKEKEWLAKVAAMNARQRKRTAETKGT